MSVRLAAANGALPSPEHAEAPPRRAPVDYDFQTVLSAAPKQRFILWLLVVLVASMVAGLIIAKVDIIITADGKLATGESEIVVQPLETSIVRAIEVKVGQKVQKDQVLAALDPTFTDADEKELAAKLRSLQAAFDRLGTESAGARYGATGNPEELTQVDIWRKRHEEYAARMDSSARKVQQFEADLDAHKAEADGLIEQIRLASEANGIYESLVANNLASKLKLIETRQQLVQAKSRLSTNRGEQQRLTHQIAQTTAERDAFISEWGRKLAEELAKARSDRDGAAAQLSKAELRHRMAVLRAPRDATVLEVANRPTGAVVREAEPLLRLVPADAEVLANIRIDTRDVARLRVGDPVTVKFEALPWQQFGVVHGVLKSLAPDAIADENPREAIDGMVSPALKSGSRDGPIHYRAQVELSEPKFRNLPADFALRPGMRVVADMKVGTRSVLEYILNPVTKLLSDSLREP